MIFSDEEAPPGINYWLCQVLTEAPKCPRFIVNGGSQRGLTALNKRPFDAIHTLPCGAFSLTMPTVIIIFAAIHRQTPIEDVVPVIRFKQPLPLTVMLPGDVS
jgi:hypothetical protein